MYKLHHHRNCQKGLVFTLIVALFDKKQERFTGRRFDILLSRTLGRTDIMRTEQVQREEMAQLKEMAWLKEEARVEAEAKYVEEVVVARID
jgi:hypothetical protein